eukprot:4609265-Prymnesium_polylepis.1
MLGKTEGQAQAGAPAAAPEPMETLAMTQVGQDEQITISRCARNRASPPPPSRTSGGRWRGEKNG